MRVLVTGGYGLIGSSVVAQLLRDGHDVSATGRSIAEARRRFPQVAWRIADYNRIRTVQDVAPLLAGIDAVVNCVGVLQDGLRDNAQGVHVVATAALFEACVQAGIRRVVHISAIGADCDGTTGFARGKAQADAHLAVLDLDWIILRPALVVAPAAYGGTAMLRGLAGIPVLTPIAGADSRIQVIGIGDLVKTVALALRPHAPAKVTWDVAHPQVYKLAEIVLALRRWLGFRPQPVIPVPPFLHRITAKLADALGWLGWRSPARSTTFAQLTAGVVGDPSAWMAATGIAPHSLDAVMAEHPANVQERWFARLYLLKPMAIGVLSLFWIATGLVALGAGRDSALIHLQAAGVPTALAPTLLVISSVFDMALGGLLLVRASARFALLLMLATTLFYLLAGAMFAQALWADPLGPLMKGLPLSIAILFTLAVLDER